MGDRDKTVLFDRRVDVVYGIQYAPPAKNLTPTR